MISPKWLSGIILISAVVVGFEHWIATTRNTKTDLISVIYLSQDQSFDEANISK